MTGEWIVQILDKKNYFKQHLVLIPGNLPALKPSSLRVQTEVLCLTSNNFTYCKLADMANWWDVHPIPPNTPAPFNDPATYGRISCWGYAKVLESTFEGVPAGSHVWGYLPIGTLPIDFEVKTGNVENQVIVTEAYRQNQLPLYNRYLVFPESIGKEIEAKTDGVAYDSLFRVTHLTGYLMAEYMFAQDPKQSINLTPEQADLSGATVINFAPGSKVGLAFTYALKHGRTASKPRQIVGAASDYSKAFVESTGLYDAVESTLADPFEALARLNHPKDSKIVIVDFGGRHFLQWKWAAMLVSQYPKVQFIIVGAEVSAPDAAVAPPGEPPAGLDISQVMADGLQNLAIQKAGEKEYFAGVNAAWEGLRKDGIPGFKVNWGEGMEAVKAGWTKYAENKVAAEEGLVFKV
ncbi:hypothetical protein F5Y04DRAFT_10252 [Hypomontagnella monticulosa]|nr:hypothetical protein F5Y04DRAFT_10252 [Hypomontagnella monticulosa]